MLDKELVLSGLSRAVLAYFLLEQFYVFFFVRGTSSQNLFLPLVGYFIFNFLSIIFGMSVVVNKRKKIESFFIALGSPLCFHLPLFFNFLLFYLPFRKKVPSPPPIQNLYFFLVSLASGVFVLLIALLFRRKGLSEKVK